jgi:alpha-glucosidase
MTHKCLDLKHFQALGQVNFVERTARGVLISVGDEKLRIDVIRPDLVRLKISRGRLFDEQPTFAASFDMPEPPRFEVAEGADSLELITSALRITVDKQKFALSAHRTDGTTIFEDAKDASGNPIGYLFLNDTFVITRRIGLHDAIYGLGEKSGSFDRRGRNFVLWNIDILMPDVLRLNNLYETDITKTGDDPEFDPYYASIPFFYHCTAHRHEASMAGFFIDNGYKANFEFVHKDVYRYQFHGGQYTEYVFAGPRMPDILSAYTFITGRMSVPPLWALGHHQCRFHGYTDESLLAVGREYRARNIPCDVLWLDIGHMHEYRVFTWDPRRFPDIPKMQSRLREQGFRMVTIADPGVKVEPGNRIYEEGKKLNLFCKTESGGHYYGQVWPGLTVFPDFSKAETREWWGQLNAEHVANGIDGIWNDMNEPATGEVPPFAMRFADGTAPHERFHNQYALLMAMSTWQGLTKAQPNQRPFILTRAGSAGIQRYAAHWLGDNYSRWDHLALSLPMAMGLGISGQPFVGADIPGFFVRPTPELAARWVQYGALTPFCRCHNNDGERDQYPWSFGAGVEERFREALNLRYRLLPYIYTATVRASETGEPIQRPLVYDFQDDRHARETEDAYLFGDSLLVAPVLEPRASARHVYFPAGTWVDWHTNETYAGGEYVTVPAPLDRIPLFARGGRIIPTHAEAPLSTMGHAPESLTLNVVVPGEDGEFHSELREDDGTSREYASGAYLRTQFLLKRQGKRLRITARVEGHGYPEFARRAFQLTFRGAKVREVVLDGFVLKPDENGWKFPNAGQVFELDCELGETNLGVSPLRGKAQRLPNM